MPGNKAATAPKPAQGGTEHISAAEFNAERKNASRAKFGADKGTNKFGAVKERGFDSQKEAERWYQLCLLQRAGKIRDLDRQVPFLLIGKNKRDDGKTELACKYFADFVYIDSETGKKVVEDVKGYKQGAAYQLYVVKRKLMLEKFGITIKEV